MAYCTRSDIEAVYGPKNVAKWADLDNDGDQTAITARIAAAITYAEAYLNSALVGTRYAVPFSTVPTLIADMAAKTAGLWLYESRGAEDISPDTGIPVHRLAMQRSEVNQKLRAIRSGGLPLYGATPVTTGTPVVVAVPEAEASASVDEIITV